MFDHIEQAHFQVSNVVGPTRDVTNIQLVPGRKKGKVTETFPWVDTRENTSHNN